MPEALKTAKLKNSGEMQVMQRGNLTAYAWKDKKIFTDLSTILDPLQNKVLRQSQKDDSVKEVPCSMVGESYNKFMFGTLQTKSVCSILKDEDNWKYLRSIRDSIIRISRW